MLRKLVLALFLIFMSAAAYAADVDLVMGNPSNATDDPSSKNNFLMNKDFFALSYNNATGTPNWVAWHLEKKDLGNLPRPRRFSEDANLPGGFTKITHEDYTHSGFDRGHMCPHSDRCKTDPTQ